MYSATRVGEKHLSIKSGHLLAKTKRKIRARNTFPASVARDFQRALEKIIESLSGEVMSILDRELRPIIDAQALKLQAHYTHSLGDDIRALFTRLYAMLSRLFPISLSVKLATDVNRNVERAVQKDIVSQIKRATGKEIAMLFPEKRLRATSEALVAETVRLIQDLPQEYIRRIEGKVYDALERGIPYRDLAEDLENEVNIAKSRARTIAVDQINRHYNWSAQVRYEELGVQHFIFITAKDERVCPICAPLDGTRHTLESLRELLPHHVNCRCTSIADPDELTLALG